MSREHALGLIILTSWVLGAGFGRTLTIEAKKEGPPGPPFLYVLLVVVCLVLGWAWALGEFITWLFRSPEHDIDS